MPSGNLPIHCRVKALLDERRGAILKNSKFLKNDEKLQNKVIFRNMD